MHFNTLKHVFPATTLRTLEGERMSFHLCIPSAWHIVNDQINQFWGWVVKVISQLFLTSLKLLYNPAVTTLKARTLI